VHYLDAEHQNLIRACIAGGEPLMHDDIDQFLELPSRYPDMAFVINTNASIRSDLDPSIIRFGWLCAISLHGGEATHNAYTRSRTYERVVRRIESLSASVPVHIYCVLHEGLVERDLTDMVEVASRAGVAFIRFITPRGYGRQSAPASESVVNYAFELSRDHDWVGVKTESSDSKFMTANGELRSSN
jgi:molybdenum cofactor biosynthesis enzyme MoaA